MRTPAIQRVFRDAEPVHGKRVVLFVAPGSGEFALVAGKKIGGAVQRNRARRVLRAAIREVAPRGVAGHDVVLVAREAIRDATNPGPDHRDDRTAPAWRGAPMTSVRRVLWNAGAPARGFLIGAIRAYQLTLSRWLGGQCRFFPTCSRYAEEAIRTHGAIKGSLLASRRVLRCNPFGRGGLDPVPPAGRSKGLYDDAIQSPPSLSSADVSGRHHAG